MDKLLKVVASIIAIYRKELQSYFAAPTALLIAGVFWLLSGLFLVAILFGDGGVIDQIALRDQMGITTPPIDFPYQFMQLFLLNVLAPLSLVILPMLSMGLYAEERKRGTLELLATSPITNWAVAIGKLLGVVTFFITLILPVLTGEAIAFSAADPPMSPLIPLVAHGGLIFMAASILSLGMFVSSLTESTILAAILSFALVSVLWIIDVLAKSMGGIYGQALAHLSLLNHYTNLVKGIVDSSSLVLFASYIILGIFLTAQYIETLRHGRS